MLAACSGQQSAYEKLIADHRIARHEEFRNPQTSPLLPEDRVSFKGLGFFQIDSSYRVVAVIERLAGTDTFAMPSTGEKTRDYVTHGIAHFQLHGQTLALSLYRQVRSGADFTFIPFKDLTCGNETYGGGRYLDIHDATPDSIVIDFNLCYNPYCAYNPKYSCPIPPPANHLPVRIEAGERDYHHH
jgi:uncharacterized protein (DUF1684 family)